MKRIALMLMAIIGLGFLEEAQGQTADNGGKKILVAYFSCTGTTERVANTVAEAVGGTLYRITPAKAYTPADLDWRNKESRSSVEMADEKSRPALGDNALDAKGYDIVFLGYPIWWNLCPRPVNSFLEKYDFAGKAVIPFATSGSSPIDNSVKQLRKLYPGIGWKQGKLLNDGPEQAGTWARQAIE